jgi:hypothetical protein
MPCTGGGQPPFDRKKVLAATRAQFIASLRRKAR